MSRLLFSLLVLNIFLVGCAGSHSPVIRSSSHNLRMSPENFVAYTNQKERDPEMEALFDQALKKYSGSSFYIIEHIQAIASKYCDSPFIRYYSWLRESTKDSYGEVEFPLLLASDASTALHETAHGFASSAAFLDSPYNKSTRQALAYSAPSEITAYYLEDWGVNYILQTESVPAKQITPYIRNSEIISTGRYQEYIEPSGPTNSTQVDGIYGLVDEYHAYYHTLMMDYNIALDPELDLGDKVPRGESYLSRFSDMHIAYYQFTLYILSYFRMVEDEYPRIFEKLMNNQELLKAIVRIHDAGKNLSQRYIELITEDQYKKDFSRSAFYKNYITHSQEYNLPENQGMLLKIRGRVSL